MYMFGEKPLVHEGKKLFLWHKVSKRYKKIHRLFEKRHLMTAFDFYLP